MSYQIHINPSNLSDSPANKTVLIPCCSLHICKWDIQGMKTEFCNDYIENAV